jgi:hypothetical protein
VSMPSRLLQPRGGCTSVIRIWISNFDDNSTEAILTCPTLEAANETDVPLVGLASVRVYGLKPAKDVSVRKCKWPSFPATRLGSTAFAQISRMTRYVRNGSSAHRAFF